MVMVRTSSFSCSIILLVSWTSMIFSMVFPYDWYDSWLRLLAWLTCAADQTRCILVKISSRWQRMRTPISSPSLSRSSTTVPNSSSALE